jgi:hypothetical protein
MPAGAEAPWRCIVATGIPKEISYMGSFLFIFFKNAEEMLMAIIYLPHDHPNIFLINVGVKSLKTDMGVNCYFRSVAFYI